MIVPDRLAQTVFDQPRTMLSNSELVQICQTCSGDVEGEYEGEFNLFEDCNEGYVVPHISFVSFVITNFSD